MGRIRTTDIRRLPREPYLPIEGEQWRKVSGFPTYSVSSIGRVRNDETCMIMRPQTGKSGYLKVSIYRNKRSKHFSINRLVCTAFNGEPPASGLHAAHLNGDRRNNCATNLVWATPLENEQHKTFHGTNAVGERVANAKLIPNQVCEIWSSAIPTTLAAKKFSVSLVTIKNIRSGKVWRHVTSALPSQPARVSLNSLHPSIRDAAKRSWANG